MLIYENQCVDCGKPCLFEGCPYWSVPMCNCDNCDAPAVYRIDGADFCEQCAKNYLLDLLSEETVESLADILETRIEWGYIDTIIE